MENEILDLRERHNQSFQKGSNNYNINVLEKLYNVCKISIDNNLFGSGFFVILKINKEDKYYLMTNEHVITKEMVRKKKIVKISIEKKNKDFTIKLDKRFIRSFDYMPMDIIIIQILPSDNIGKDFYFRPNLKYQNDPTQIIKKKILVAHYAKGLILQIDDGEITDIIPIKNEFIHKASTDKGSSGALIIEFNDDNALALGIHKQGSDDGNIAHFIYPICKCLENDNNYIEELIYEEGIYRGDFIKINNKRDGYGEFKFKNGEVYKGQWKKDKKNGYGEFKFKNGEVYKGQWEKDKKNGFGIEYYKNKKIKYKGVFKENEYSGEGIYIWENGEYYKGNFENSKANGEGEYHYSNGDIYKGKFVNNIKEGKGIYTCKNGNQFIGIWKNDVQNGNGKYYENKKLIYEGMVIIGIKYGKGKEYYSNGKIKYDGLFDNDKYHGNGKLYLNNYDKVNSNLYYLYYDGNWKYGQRSGKGIEYYPNGKIKYDGLFDNDKYHGNGTLFFHNNKGNLENINYIGEWKYGLKCGRGKEYLPNGKLVYEGLFDNNKYNDEEGKLYFRNGYYYIGKLVNGQMQGKGILSFNHNYHLDKTIEVMSNLIENPEEILDDIELFTNNALKGDFSRMEKYEGYFVNNNKEGFGICYYKNGSYYSGYWKNNKYNGKGKFYKKNGKYIEGEWKNGKKNGHMILYDRSGTILDEGDFIEDKLINDSSVSSISKKISFSLL